MEKGSGLNRRKFLTSTAKGSIAVGLGFTALPELLSSCSNTKKIVSVPFATSFTQQPLPYKYNALENVIDAQTMELHYSKHGAAYAKSLGEAVIAEKLSSGTSLENILQNISKYSVKMRNNAGGHYNHEMFWQSMRPKTSDNKPSGKLLAAIEQQFGSFANLKSKFSDAAKTRFGSGWAWLYTDSTKMLKIGSSANQDNPLMDISEIKGFPVLGLDVWEHAYYLKYQNKRADYVDNWWNVVNWDYVQQRYEAI